MNKYHMADRLALAAGALLGSGLSSAAAGGSQVDVAVLHWAEADRVSAVEPVVSLRHELGDDRSLSVKLVLDSLSGASHNGAGVQAFPQTFSSASGGGGAGYTVPEGAVPLDPGFEDFRTAANIGYETALANPLWKASLGGAVSSETDFLSLALSGSLARDFNMRNTTVIGALSLESDSISPAAGAPVPFAVKPVATGGEPEGEAEGEDGEGGTPPAESRRVVDVMLGVTQVVNRTTLAQFNLAFSRARGYMNDPYKIITVDAAPLSYVYENRPDARDKVSFYGGIRHAFASENVLDLGYRWMQDDWGVASHTLDLYYRIALPGNWYVEPHARGYMQTAADFFVMSLSPVAVPAAGTTTAFASGDYRLGALTDTTLGARVGVKLSERSDVYLRAEQFRQRGDWSPASLDATILEIGGSWRY